MESFSESPAFTSRGEAIFHTNLCPSERFRQRTDTLRLVYKELVLTWEKYSVSKSLTACQIATQSLWNNEFIHTKSESLYDEPLVSKTDLKLVSDSYSRFRIRIRSFVFGSRIRNWKI